MTPETFINVLICYAVWGMNCYTFGAHADYWREVAERRKRVIDGLDSELSRVRKQYNDLYFEEKIFKNIGMNGPSEELLAWADEQDKILNGTGEHDPLGFIAASDFLKQLKKDGA